MMACIYKVTNKLNKKTYIGYSKNFAKRKSVHKENALKRNVGFVFYQAIRKYGWDNFEWEIIYESWDDKHCLTVMEPYFITEYNSFGENGYNMTRGGERGPDTIKRKPLTEEQKNNISVQTKKNALRGENHPMYGTKANSKFLQSAKTSMLGKQHSEETKKQQSNSRKEYLKLNNAGMLGKKHSTETKQKMKSKRLEKWELYNGETKQTILIDDLMEYSTINNINYKTVYAWTYQIIDGKQRLKKVENGS
jgi:group I intron endonuclease